MSHSGGRFDFDDGGTYCGGWEDGKAHGHGICTGPKGQGEYAGSWNHGFEVLGVYTWPSGNTYEGNWSQGKRHNLGVESKGRWQYKGEWGHGFKGRYGVRGNTASRAKYEGTWSNGLQDGYGTETYADGGTYQGQWVGGMRQGSGIRQSMPYGMASVVRNSLRTSMSSLKSELSNGTMQPNTDLAPDAPQGSRGGFVLTRHQTMTSPSVAPSSSQKKRHLFRSSSTSLRRSIMSGLKLRSKSSSSIASASSLQSSKSFKSTTATISSTDTDCSSMYNYGAAQPLYPIEDEVDPNTTEAYYGEWKNDSRTGFGICQRSDGFMYEGEWLDNQRFGYGSTTFPDGTKEEGKYKNNLICTGSRKNNLVPMKSSKIKAKVSRAVAHARKAKETAIQKCDIASSRTAHSVAKANQAETVATNAKDEAKIARCVAHDLAPNFHQPGLSYLKLKGEDPFKEMENSSTQYIGDSADVGGPENYHQFSNTNKSATPLQVSPIPSRHGSIDANSMNIMEIKNISINQQMVDSAKIKRSSMARGDLFPKSTYQETEVFPNSAPKMQYLSPESALSTNVYPSKAQLDPVLPEIHTPAGNEASSQSKEKEKEATTPHHKHSFFRSLRIKHKKSTVKEPRIEETSSSSKNDSGIMADDDLSEVGWSKNTAENKRSIFKKAYSMPERLQHSQSNSNVDSFDYHTNQAEFLSGYESEMQPLKSTENATPSHGQNIFQYPPHASYISGYGDHVSGSPNHSTHSGGQSNSDYRPQTHITGVSRGNSPNMIRGHNIGADNLKMTALRPRHNATDSDASVAPIITPAFAYYTAPAGDGRDTSKMKKKLTPSVRSENTPQEDEFSLARTSPRVYAASPKRSPLPGNLRRRGVNDVINVGDVMDTTVATDDEDPARIYLIILVILLNLGFVVLFVQFLT